MEVTFNQGDNLNLISALGEPVGSPGPDPTQVSMGACFLPVCPIPLTLTPLYLGSLCGFESVEGTMEARHSRTDQGSPSWLPRLEHSRRAGLAWAALQIGAGESICSPDLEVR